MTTQFNSLSSLIIIIPNNKPDIIIRDNKKNLIAKNFAIPGDRNVIKKEAENILKYKAS